MHLRILPDHQNLCLKKYFVRSEVVKKNIFFQAMILVVWKYVQMHQIIFLTTLDLKKKIFSGHDSVGL